MANPWFRLYNEFATDPKVQSMPEIMQRRLVMLFCLRCGNVLETLQEHELIFALGISEEEWQKTKELFVSKCFIAFHENKCNIKNWNKRQFVSDLSTVRVRKWRGKKETLQKRCKSVSATPPDTDTDTDTDTDKNKSKRTVSFQKPTLEEVTAYCKERGKGVNPEAWMNHYESNGWKVGSNPMKSWKAAIHTWEHSGFAKPAVVVETTEEMLRRIGKIK